jgi:hypothetical protein
MQEVVMNRILELYGVSTADVNIDWPVVVAQQQCPYLQRQCTKRRKSAPELTIGSCSVMVGRDNKSIMICPNRLLEQRQVFLDCFHLLTRHEPGNQLHVVSEVTIPGGSVDYFLVSVRRGKVQDFVGLELQALDTTGTIWPLRQQIVENLDSLEDKRSFGVNWKMTAKTTLIQLNHKIQTFEHVGKSLVLVCQDHLLAYMRSAFQFEHIGPARLGDSMQFHLYGLSLSSEDTWHISLTERFSTDAAGISRSLGLQSDPRIEWEQITKALEAKISGETLFQL